MMQLTQPRPSIWKPIATAFLSLATLLPLVGCSQVITEEYEATAVTTYVWQVQYTTDPQKTQGARIERFASTSLTNRNGFRPDNAVTGPDDQGLWWPDLPPRPTVDEMEARQQSPETIGTPEIIKRVDFTLTYQADGTVETLPTDYSVYRQAVQAHSSARPLELTLGVGDASVEKADMR